MQDELNVSELLNLDHNSKSVKGFYEPLITIAFNPGTREQQNANEECTQIFIQVYHRLQQKSYNLIYDYAKQEQVGETTVVALGQCSQINFCIKTFFSEDTNNFTTFFRQGECVTVPQDLSAPARVEKITDADLGSMYLLYDEALITQSSSSILFFRVNKETKLWEQYHKIEKMRGQIFFIRGNVRF